MKNDFNPKVSIIIPVYNGQNYLTQAIDSALNQTYPDIEVIVVSDGSTDNSDRIAKSYGNKIKYFKKSNGGVSTALNLGIKKSKGQYISWLSHDDIYLKNKIKIQVDALKKLNPEKRQKTILYSNYKVIDKNSKTIEIPAIHKIHSSEKLHLGLYSVFNGLIFGCTLLIPKKCFQEIGYFDPKLRSSQDYDMWYRLFSKYNIVFQKDYLVHSRKHSQQGTHQPHFLVESNQIWIKMLKNTSDEDKINISGSLKKFYKNNYKLMKRVGYEKAAQYSKNQLDKLGQPFLTKIISIFSKLR